MKKMSKICKAYFDKKKKMRNKMRKVKIKKSEKKIFSKNFHISHIHKIV